MKVNLEWFEQEITEREKKISNLEKEIEELVTQKADFIEKNCNHKKENKCDYFGSDLNDCSDCSRHLDIGQIK